MWVVGVVVPTFAATILDSYFHHFPSASLLYHLCASFFSKGEYQNKAFLTIQAKDILYIHHVGFFIFCIFNCKSLGSLFIQLSLFLFRLHSLVLLFLKRRYLLDLIYASLLSFSHSRRIHTPCMKVWYIFATHKLIIAAGKTQPPWDFSQLTLQYMDENVELYSEE